MKDHVSTSVMRLRGPASLIDCHKGVEVMEARVSVDNLGCLGLTHVGEAEADPKAGALVQHEPDDDS